MPDFHQVAEAVNMWLQEQGILPPGGVFLRGYASRASAIGAPANRLNIHVQEDRIVILARTLDCPNVKYPLPPFDVPEDDEPPQRAAQRAGDLNELIALYIHINPAPPAARLLPANVSVGPIRRIAGYRCFELWRNDRANYTVADLVALFQAIHPALLARYPHYVM
jgi:hypothetical protein